MKDLKNSRQWFSLAAKELTPNELKVFVNWFTDDPGFSAGASLLHQRLPFIARQNIDRALKGLERKNFLTRVGNLRNGKGKPTPKFDLNASLLMHYQASIMHQSEGHNASMEGSKCITTDACSRKEVESSTSTSTLINYTVAATEPGEVSTIKPETALSTEPDINLVCDQIERLQTLFHLSDEGQISLTPWECTNYSAWIKDLKKYQKCPLTPGKLRNLATKEKAVHIPLNRYNYKKHYEELTSMIRSAVSFRDTTLDEARLDAIKRYAQLHPDGESRISKAMKHIKVETIQDLISGAVGDDPQPTIPTAQEASNSPTKAQEVSAGNLYERLDEFDKKKPLIWRLPNKYQSQLKSLSQEINRSGDDNEIDRLLTKFNNLYEEASKPQQQVR